jgi:hypothetical protein
MISSHFVVLLSKGNRVAGTISAACSGSKIDDLGP